MKKPNLAIVLYSYLLLFGITMLMVLSVMIIAGSTLVPGGTAILVIILILALTISIKGIVKWRKYKKNTPDYKLHPLAIFFLVLFIIGGLSTYVVAFPRLYVSLHIKAVVGPYVKDEFTEANVPMPDDPYFVFYNMDNKSFAAPAKKYNRGTKDPKKANVVVAYSTDVRNNGKWVEAGTGKYAGEAYEQCVYLYVVRISDWALIDNTVVAEQMDYGKKNKRLDTKAIDGIDEVAYYLNRLFK